MLGWHELEPTNKRSRLAHAPFDDDDWNSLLDHMANGHVLPVIGPGLVTVALEGAQQPLYDVLAAPLARKLGLAESISKECINTMQMAREAISRGVSATHVWDRLKAMLKTYTEPGAGLRALAAINCFDLYIASTPDELMVQALKT